MSKDCEQSEPSSGKFIHTVQPQRDLESNWSVDLAKNLEDYLLKICSGELSEQDGAHLSVNFAEAALLLQGSVQVYSRKVEYLYSLVLHALEFISKKSQEDQEASTSTQQKQNDSRNATDEECDNFWGLDDVPAEAKNSLDSATCKDIPTSYFVRPPANLIVLEGDCLDSGSDAGELESYLLASNDLYQDFILLDSCDSLAVNNFLGDSKVDEEQNNFNRGSILASKGHRTFQSPIRRSGGSGLKFSVGKNQEANPTQSISNGDGFAPKDSHMESFPPAYDFPEDNDHMFEGGDGYSEHGNLDDSDDDDDDPWKPLNPHELGNLKVKPYRKVRASRRQGVGSSKPASINAEFPLAKLHGTISPELAQLWEAKNGASEGQRHLQDLPLYEKLRQSLVLGRSKTGDAFSDPEVDNEDDGNDSGDLDGDIPDNTPMDEDAPSFQEKHDYGGGHFDYRETCDDPFTNENLEDLCQSHLDALLASLAENEKQTELATRVSTWKQRIEKDLEEEDARPPFDIHEYGERVLDKLSKKEDGETAMSFGEIVQGQERRDVARTFSALLQLVNNRDLDILKNSKGSESQCYTSVNPFYVQPLRNEPRRVEMKLPTTKKRAKSPPVKGYAGGGQYRLGKENQPSFNLGKASISRCTPEGKKRRKSTAIARPDLHYAA